MTVMRCLPPKVGRQRDLFLYSDLDWSHCLGLDCGRCSGGPLVMIQSTMVISWAAEITGTG